jgi:hypothetical protein
MQAMKRLLPVISALVVAGCASIGPKTVPRDRFDYVEAISDSWQRQMLLNLLKVRYADAPVFLDVTSVIASYEFKGEVGAFGQEAPQGRAGDSFIGGIANGSYTDRPTITYAPLSNDKFAKSLMAPIPITGIVLLLQAGYPADVVLRVCSNSINNLSNSYGGLGARRGDPRFQELLSLLRKQQEEGLLAVFSKRETDQQVVRLSLRESEHEASKVRARRIAELLGVDPVTREFNVVYGAQPLNPAEIAIQSRSMMQVLVDVGSYIDVPRQDSDEGRVYMPQRDEEGERLFPPPLRVYSGEHAPDDAFVTVPYRGGWFWIDDRDHRSKAAFNFVMLLFSLTETGSAQAGPVVTVPTR